MVDVSADQWDEFTNDLARLARRAVERTREKMASRQLGEDYRINMTIKPIQKPEGVFSELPNFMTPNVLAYYKLRKGYAELSEGTGMDRQPIFGVTVEPDTDRARSKLCQSKREALDYIQSMS